MRTILFVCHGNMHRSVIGELLLKKKFADDQIKGYEIYSRGLQGLPGSQPPKGRNLYDYPDQYRLTRPFLDRFGISISENQVSTTADETILHNTDLILVMEKKVLVGLPYSLLQLFPQHCYKARLFRELEGIPNGIPDCGDSTDPKLFDEAIMCIYRIISTKVNDIITLADIFAEKYSQKIGG